MAIDTHFAYLRDLVRRNAAIVLESDKSYVVEKKLRSVAEGAGLGNLDALFRRMRREPLGPLHWQVIEALTINETSFFRDNHPFALLQGHLLPRLLEQRLATKQLTCWSAACSSGQEAYSMGMLLREHGPALGEWKVRILGTDLSHEVVDRARAGAYSQLEVSRGLPAALLVKYFDRKGAGFQIKDEVRRLVDFQQGNLMKPLGGLPRFDLIFLRNVLIYFDAATRKGILARIRQQLRTPGYLVLSASESTLPISGFKGVTVGGSTYFEALP